MTLASACGPARFSLLPSTILVRAVMGLHACLLAHYNGHNLPLLWRVWCQV